MKYYIYTKINFLMNEYFLIIVIHTRLYYL